MSTRQEETQDGTMPRLAQIQAVLHEHKCRRAAGDSMTDATLMAAHPELMPELAAELRKLRIIAAAREKAMAPPTDDSDKTLEHTPGRKDSRGLHIRCPHCS